MLQDLEEFRALKSCVDVVLLQPPRGQFIRGYARIENRRSRARTRNGQQFLGGNYKGRERS
ncbi:hypothetical protein LB506_008771 [Fusarium annulatum]|nr:hypothetical protein LB506_008771 [Fusarium annulatum]